MLGFYSFISCMSVGLFDSQRQRLRNNFPRRFCHKPTRAAQLCKALPLLNADAKIRHRFILPDHA